MKTNLPAFARTYLEALRKHLKDEPAFVPIAAEELLGERAVEVGLETLDLAKVHEEALIDAVPPNETRGEREKSVRRAGQFFDEAITPIELTHRGALEANEHLKVMVD